MKLFSKMLRDEWVKLVAFFIFMSAVAVAQTVLWPKIRIMLPSILELVPQKFKWMIGGMQTEGFVYFTITQQMMKNIGMFGSALAVILGASAVSKEIEAGTMELLLAQPISRKRVLLEKYLFNLGILFIPVVISTLLTYPAALIIGESISLTGLLITGLYGFFIVAVVYSFSFFLGVMIDTQMQVIVAGLGFCLVMFILTVFKSTSFLSLYGYMDLDIMRQIFALGSIPSIEMIVFAMLCAAFFAASWWRFSKKTI
jgi:ABC-type transport system involved in multi-copper enzyme maturation permease subunit